MPGALHDSRKRCSSLLLRWAVQLIGARLATKLGMVVSGATLLRYIRPERVSDRPTPRVLGVDDWA